LSTKSWLKYGALIMPGKKRVSSGSKASKTGADVKTLFQFKITLLNSKPPIWRRIQVHDGTLDKLHEHIQTAMGWMNCHLHQFKIDGQVYADPDLMEEDFEAWGCADSTSTMVSDVLPQNAKRCSFFYEYDFGDSWHHEVLFEGCPPPEPRFKYPRCLEGERACPPEDIGGIYGYYNYLAALADPKHEMHDAYLQWNGPFEPENFDSVKATRAMRKGLPDWRKEDPW
jgi:hypothetical protein